MQLNYSGPPVSHAVKLEEAERTASSEEKSYWHASLDAGTVQSGCIKSGKFFVLFVTHLTN